MKRSLSKSELLRKRRDIKNLFFSQRQFSCKGAKMLLADNPTGGTRILVSLSRGYGTSVERNRAKRIGKEVYRLNKERISEGFDIGFVFFPGSYDYSARESQILGLLKRAHILN